MTLKQLIVWVRHPERVTLGTVNERLRNHGVRVVGHLSRGDKEVGEAFSFAGDVLLQDLSVVEALDEARAQEDDAVAASVAVNFLESADASRDTNELSGQYDYGFRLTTQIVSFEGKMFLGQLADAIAVTGSGEVEVITAS
jgi:hypothetical protein